MMQVNDRHHGLLFPVFVVALVLHFNALPAVAQFIENFGHAGHMRTLKGQIRDGLDNPIPSARLHIKRLSDDKLYSTDGDEKGIFQKDDLPSGKYEVLVWASGFNIGKYTLDVDSNGKNASEKYSIIRLSPGCASGNSGLVLVKSLDQPSFRP
ncbi:MAG: carboxypeptidase-like regulatory domain-containing protein [Pyrinomonadaceae bacterium]